MVSRLVVYDLIFLVAFTLVVTIFLYKRRKNLERQGLLYLYKTRVGIRFIEWTSIKFPKTLRALQYVVITSGYALMISMTYLLIRFSYFYITSPIAAKALKIPVIVPLVPYLPEIFHLDFLPPFYFTYWIIIIAIIAIPHEFAHGIFAALNKIKIHSTGFGFLGPFLAAFVEPDEKEMEKRGKFAQLSVLGAGTFANIVFTVIFGLIFWLFFVTAFSPAGVIFNSYAANYVPVSAIDSINGNAVSSLEEFSSFLDINESFISVDVDGKTFFVSPSQLSAAIKNKDSNVVGVFDSPAFREKLSGVISKVDGEKIVSFDQLKKILDGKSPGDKIMIETLQENDQIKNYDIELDERDGKAFLGIAISPPQTRGLLGSVYAFITKIKDPLIYYQSSLGDFGIFIYNLLWWIVLINISVALVNMLPLGIFDGGRFFYLTVWGLTKSKKIGEKAFKLSTWIMLAIVALLMIKWLFIFV